jgi:dTMP kinase
VHIGADRASADADSPMVDVGGVRAPAASALPELDGQAGPPERPGEPRATPRAPRVMPAPGPPAPMPPPPAAPARAVPPVELAEPTGSLPVTESPGSDLPTGPLPAGPPPASASPERPAISSVAALKGVLRTKPFRRLWYATALSSLGDWLGLLATTALATSLAHGYQAQNYALGGVLVVKLLPAIVLGPLAGAFADRFDRRRTMIVGDSVRFVLFLTIPIAHLVVTEHQTLVWLYIASFLIECVSLFWLPAKDASVPNLVRRDQIEPANQLSLITTYGITPVLGAALFSVLSLITNVLARHLSFFRTNPTNLALYLNAATFLVGAVIVYFIREISGHRANGAGGDQPGLFALIREGARFVRSSRLVRGLIIGLIGAFAAGGGVIGAGKIFVSSLGGGNAAYGVLFGSVFVGLGAGMAFGPRIAGELSRRRLFGVSIVFGGICLVLAAVMPQVALAMIFVLGVGFGAGIAYLSGTTLMGTDVDDEIRGRIFALLQSLIRIVLILSLASVPFVVAQVGRNTFEIGGAHVTVDGTRIVLVAGGLLAIAAGVLAYWAMDDKQKTPIWADIKASLRGDSAARRRMLTGGVLIAFEGGEGSGKSTQARLLAEALANTDLTVRVTHEPGATLAGRKIRELVLHEDEPLAPRTEALLFAADRAQHVDTVIKPGLDAGEVVITDRFSDSSLAYQGVGRDLKIEDIRRISRWAAGGVTPDLVVLLDVSAEVGLTRVRGRGAPDRLERESIEFHERVRQAFRALAEADSRRYLMLDGSRPPEELAARVREAVDRLLAARRSGHRRMRARQGELA